MDVVGKWGGGVIFLCEFIICFFVYIFVEFVLKVISVTKGRWGFLERFLLFFSVVFFGGAYDFLDL